jgi:hypothetical protein
MNLGDAKNVALKLIDEYSLRGVIQSSGTNADYALRMNAFADLAQKEISDKVGIGATYTITQTQTPDLIENGNYKYLLPSDMKDYRYCTVSDYRYYDYNIRDGYFIVGSNAPQNYTLHYFRYPTTITDNTPNNYVFEVDGFTHEIIPFYIGGMLLTSASEDTGLSGKLLNMYYSKLSSLYNRENAFPKRTRDTVRW